jgi:hypothetical protein
MGGRTFVFKSNKIATLPNNPKNVSDKRTDEIFDLISPILVTNTYELINNTQTWLLLHYITKPIP